MAAVFWTSRNADGRLSIAKAFTSLAIVTLVSSPLALLVAVRSIVAASLGCFSRIQKFLLLDERSDYRNFLTTHYSPNEQPGQGIELSPLSWPMVELRQASFCAADGTVLVRNADVLIQDASCHVVLGPVGSGKSSLFNAILGELRLATGSAKLKMDSVAYCAQTPWLRNVSIRENIVGDAEFGFDAEWFTRVVTACALDRDFCSLPHGYETTVGSGGLSLSGGQKQRIVGFLYLFLPFFPTFSSLFLFSFFSLSSLFFSFFSFSLSFFLSRFVSPPPVYLE